MAFLTPVEFARVWLLRPELFSVLQQHMAEFERVTGKKTYVGAAGGVRSNAVQAATYADSIRSGFRAAPPGKSPHEFGAAYDLIIVGTGKDAATDKANPLYETLARVGESFGLVAGQHFKTGKPDPYHFQLNESLPVMRAKWDTLTRGRLWRAVGIGLSLAGIILSLNALRRRKHVAQ